MPQASRTDAPAASRTISKSQSIRWLHPMTIAAAIPRIGVIRGAINMAAMTTAPESRSSPMEAMMTDRVRSAANRRQ